MGNLWIQRKEPIYDTAILVDVRLVSDWNIHDMLSEINTNVCFPKQEGVSHGKPSERSLTLCSWSAVALSLF